MRGRVRAAVAGALVAGAAVAGTVALADGGKGIRETLTGYEEDPLTLSTTGSGEFSASIKAKKGDAIRYQLSYAGLEGNITQAHIHFGGRAQSGGIAVFLCANPNPPAIDPPPGTQLCPPAPATIRGTIRSADVIGPAAQGIDPGEFDELLDAIGAGVTYVNVHSSKYPGGEIRAQLEPSHDD
jgi:CHRD domain